MSDHQADPDNAPKRPSDVLQVCGNGQRVFAVTHNAQRQCFSALQNIHALSGESEAPRLRNGTVRTRKANAIGANGSVNQAPNASRGIIVRSVNNLCFPPFQLNLPESVITPPMAVP